LREKRAVHVYLRRRRLQPLLTVRALGRLYR